MVLRLFLLCSFLLAQPVSAKNNVNLFQVAVKFHNKEQYEKSNKILNTYFKPFKSQADKRVYLLMGSNYEFQNEHAKAKSTYITLLKIYYESSYRRDFMKIKKVGLENFDDEIEDELAAIYYKVGVSLIKLADQKYESEKEYKRDLKLARIFLTLAGKADGDISDLADEKSEKISKLEEKISLNTSKYRFGFVVGKMFWNDQFILKDIVTADEEKIISNSDINTIAVELRKQSGVYFTRFMFGGLAGTSVVGEKNNYFTKNATTLGSFLITSFNWISPYKDASFGLSFPILNRSINLKNSQSKEVEPKTLVSYGYGFDFNWDWKNINFGMGINMMTGFDSSTWRLELGYLF